MVLAQYACDATMVSDQSNMTSPSLLLYPRYPAPRVNSSVKERNRTIRHVQLVTNLLLLRPRYAGEQGGESYSKARSTGQSWSAQLN